MAAKSRFAWDGGQRRKRDIYVKVVGEGEPLRIPRRKRKTGFRRGRRTAATSLGGMPGAQGRQTVFVGFTAWVAPGRRIRRGRRRSRMVAPTATLWCWPRPCRRRVTAGSCRFGYDTGETVASLTAPNPCETPARSVSRTGKRGHPFEKKKSEPDRTRAVDGMTRGGDAGKSRRREAGVRRHVDRQQPVCGYFQQSRAPARTPHVLGKRRRSGTGLLLGLRNAFYPTISRTGNRLVYTDKPSTIPAVYG